jgi:hypothetical protein
MPSWRELWKAWDQNPVSIANRKFIYRIYGPLSVVAVVAFAAMGEWIAVLFAFVLLALAIVSGARTQGTTIERCVSVLRRWRR